jgi:uncharacterized cupredoxin-like copper-binding protein
MNRYIVAAAFAALSSSAWAHDEHMHHPLATVDYSKAAATKFGRPADPRKALRTIHVEMSDAMSFTPSLITVKRGETVRLMATNKGKVMHEMVLGTAAELKEHSEMMKQRPDMKHSEPHMAHVSPGKSGEIGWQFTEPGEFYFACLVPGHFEAGMVGRILVND